MKKTVGIDLRGDSIRLAYFEEDRLKKTAVLPLPEGVVAEGRILAPNAVADILRAGLAVQQLRVRQAAVVLPSAPVLSRTVTVPVMTERQLRSNLPFQFRELLDGDRDGYAFDYSLRALRRDAQGAVREMEILACAVAKNEIQRYRDVMRLAGLRMAALVPAHCALEALVEKRGGECAVLALDAERTALYLYHGGQFDSLRQIELPLTPENHGRLGIEVVKAVNFYNYNNRERELSDIYLCGAEQERGVMAALAENSRLQLHPAQDLLAESERPALFACAIGAVRQSGRRAAEIPAGRLPGKVGIDLNRREDRTAVYARYGAVAAAAVLSVALVAKLGFLDPIARRDEAKAAAAQANAQYYLLEQSMSDYEQVLTQYRTYSRAWLADGSVQTGVTVPRVKVLAMIEEEMMTRGVVRGISLSGNALTVQMTGMNLEQISEMFHSLRRQSMVAEVSLDVAATDKSATSLSFRVNIVLCEEVEPSCVD